MKCFLISMVLIISPVLSSNQNNSVLKDGQEDPGIIFISLDRALVSLWLSCKEHNIESSSIDLNRLNSSWKDARVLLLDQKIQHLNLDEMVGEIDFVIEEIENHLDLNQFVPAELYTFHILWIFKEIRYSTTDTKYPLDRLIQIKEQQDELSYIVNDEMMGLYEWNEFTLMIENFKKEVKKYEGESLQTTNEFFNSLNQDLHDVKLESLKQKLKAFEQSLESAYRTDLIDPCVELEVSILNLFRIYAKHDLQF